MILHCHTRSRFHTRFRPFANLAGRGAVGHGLLMPKRFGIATIAPHVSLNHVAAVRVIPRQVVRFYRTRRNRRTAVTTASPAKRAGGQRPANLGWVVDFLVHGHNGIQCALTALRGKLAVEGRTTGAKLLGKLFCISLLRNAVFPSPSVPNFVTQQLRTLRSVLSNQNLFVVVIAPRPASLPVANDRARTNDDAIRRANFQNHDLNPCESCPGPWEVQPSYKRGHNLITTIPNSQEKILDLFGRTKREHKWNT